MFIISVLIIFPSTADFHPFQLSQELTPDALIQELRYTCQV